MYDQWYEIYVDEMFAYAMAFGIERDTALDAIHDVFLHLYEQEDKIKITTNVKFYLLCSVKNRIISLKRKEIPCQNIEDSNEYEFTIKVEGSELIEKEEERKEFAEQIKYLLNLLTNKQREVIYLHFMQELSYEEIAEILQISTKSTRKLAYRAIERMQSESLPFILLYLSESGLRELFLNRLLLS